MIEIISFFLGLIIGSFLNVVIARLPKEESIVFPRSHCPHCHQSLGVFQLIPVVSFLYQKGKCDYCKSPISIQYPLVELITGFVFLMICLKQNQLDLISSFTFASILIAVSVIDFHHRIIPDELSIGGALIGIVFSIVNLNGISVFDSILGAGLGFGFFYLFAWLYETRTGRMGLGGGDIKLMAMIGSFIGPSGVFFTVLFGSILGSLGGIGVAAYTNWRESKKGISNQLLMSTLPFGPYLSFTALLYLFFGDSEWIKILIPS
jgi:leader peptidase (prepilin peptidase) / N-methyltransferase